MRQFTRSSQTSIGGHILAYCRAQLLFG